MRTSCGKSTKGRWRTLAGNMCFANYVAYFCSNYLAHTSLDLSCLSCSATANVTTYQILTEHVTSSTASSSEVGPVRLTASSWGSTATQWSISWEQLSSSLTRIIGKATTAEVLDCFRVGQVMRLPGTYNCYELVRLGYRKHSGTIGLRREAGVR